MPDLQLKTVDAVVVLERSSGAMAAKIETAKGKALQRIDLSSVNTNLLNAAGLLHVAHQALAGTKIQSKLTGLKFELLQACDTSLNTISDFSEMGDDIIDYIADAYNFLLQGEDAAALSSFADCKETASRMADACGELMTAFGAMADKSLAALEESQDVQAVKYAKMDEIRAQLTEMRASLEGSKAVSEQLAADIEDASADLAEASRMEEAAAKRKTDMENTALWTSVLSGGLTALSGVLSLGLTTAAAAAKKDDGEADSAAHVAAEAKKAAKEEEDKLKKAQEAKQATEEEKKKADADVEKQEAAVAAAKGDLEEAKAEAENAASDEEKAEVEKKVDQKQKAFDAAEAKLADEKRIRENLRVALEAKDKVVQGLQDAFKNLSEKASDLAQAAQDELTQRMKVSSDLRNHKAALQKERRATLGNMRKMAVLVAGTKQEQDHIATAIKTLQLAIVCLQQITLALYQASQFWKNIASYCSRLADPLVGNKVNSIAKMSSSEARIVEYKKVRFQNMIMDYAAGWYALNDIYAQYLEAAGKTAEGIEKDFKVSLIREQAWKNAAEQAKAFIEDIDAQLAQVAANEKDITAEGEAEKALKKEIESMLQ